MQSEIHEKNIQIRQYGMRKIISRMWKMYLRNSNEEMKRNASPMQNVLPSKIPNTYMEATEFDCLHDEGIFYGLRLQAAGAKVIINDTKGTYHAYDAAIHKKLSIHM